MPDTHLSYPIGQFTPEPRLSAEKRELYIQQIAETPSLLATAVSGLIAEQLDTRYRTGGWTVRQVVHHIPDSHMNSYIRMKLAMTEHEPTVKPYEEQLWAELRDVQQTPVEISIALLGALHQ